ncbi:MAG: hypothetical protein ACYDAY_11585 [Candidatus Dormibacteria bacterium]
MSEQQDVQHDRHHGQTFLHQRCALPGLWERLAWALRHGDGEHQTTCPTCGIHWYWTGEAWAPASNFDLALVMAIRDVPMPSLPDLVLIHRSLTEAQLATVAAYHVRWVRDCPQCEPERGARRVYASIMEAEGARG